jgi:hypothetical protein
MSAAPPRRQTEHAPGTLEELPVERAGGHVERGRVEHGEAVCCMSLGRPVSEDSRPLRPAIAASSGNRMS